MTQSSQNSSTTMTAPDQAIDEMISYLNQLKTQPVVRRWSEVSGGRQQSNVVLITPQVSQQLTQIRLAFSALETQLFEAAASSSNRQT